MLCLCVCACVSQYISLNSTGTQWHKHAYGDTQINVCVLMEKNEKEDSKEGCSYIQIIYIYIFM